MPTYQEYLYHAAKQGFQPLSENSFRVLLVAGFNPITNTFGAKHA
jgi:hypothetical protein